MPSVGLLPDQMIHALRSMNYDPIFIEARSQEQIKHDIYSYVESQIPPILLCRLATGGNHAIVAVGHGYERPLDNPLYYQTDWLDEEPLLFARSSAWVPCFYINDDQRGIYRKLTFIKPDLTEIINHITAAHPDTQIDQEELGQWRCPVSIDLDMPNAGKEYQGNKQIANIYAIIVPLSQNVLLNAEQAEQKAALLIRYLHWLHKEPLPKNLVLRTYAIPSNDYKRMIEKRRIDDFVKQLYRGKPMPKWIWITEVSSTDSYNSPDPLKWLIKGEIIIDATGNPLSPDFIALHYIMNNIAIISTMKPDHQGPEQALNDFWYSKNDDPYPGWVR